MGMRDLASKLPRKSNSMARTLWVPLSMARMFSGGIAVNHFKGMEKVYTLLWLLIAKAPALLPLVKVHIQPQRAAGVQDIVRIEVLLKSAKDIHAWTADLPFQPGTGLFADTVMVARGW